MIVRCPEKTDRLINELYQVIAVIRPIVLIKRGLSNIFFKIQGRRWCIEEQFQTTSANINELTVYVKDVVTYTTGGTICVGKVNSFYMKVGIMIMYCYESFRNLI